MWIALLKSLKLKCKWFDTFPFNCNEFALKIGHFLVKTGPNSVQNWSIFLAISRGAFLARNVSQNHFSFSREMREMCRSTHNGGLISRKNETFQIIQTINFWQLHITSCRGRTVAHWLHIRHAHFSHFSRKREMVLRDISREKWAARNCEKNQPILSQLLASFGPNLTNIWTIFTTKLVT